MQKYLLKFDLVLFWLVLLLVIFIPLYPKFPSIGIAGSFVSIRIEDFVIAFVYFVWTINLLVTGRWKLFLKDRLNQVIFIFFFVTLVSLFSGYFLTHTVAGSLGIFHYLRRVEYILMLPLFIYVLKSIHQIKILGYTLLGVLVFVLFYALGQKYLEFKVITTVTSELSKGTIGTIDQWSRVNSTFAGYYDLAVFLMISVILMATLLIYLLSSIKIRDLGSVKNLFPAIGISFLGGISVYILIITAARISFVALIFGLFTLLVMIGKKRYILLLLVISVLAFAYPSPLRDRLISTIQISFFENSEIYRPSNNLEKEKTVLNIPTLHTTDPDPKKRLEENAKKSPDLPPDIVPGESLNPVELGVQRSISIRLDQEWPRAIRAFFKNPLLGTGYSSIGLATDNDYLRSIGEVGLLGTISFGLIFIESLKRIWRSYKSQSKLLKYFSAGVLSIVGSMLINALFTDVFEASKIAFIFWMILGVAISFGKIYIKQEQNPL